MSSYFTLRLLSIICSTTHCSLPAARCTCLIRMICAAPFPLHLPWSISYIFCILGTYGRCEYVCAIGDKRQWIICSKCMELISTISENGNFHRKRNMRAAMAVFYASFCNLSPSWWCTRTKAGWKHWCINWVFSIFFSLKASHSHTEARQKSRKKSIPLRILFWING